MFQWLSKWQDKGSGVDVKIPGLPITLRILENVICVCAAFLQSPTRSKRKYPRTLNISLDRLIRIYRRT